MELRQVEYFLAIVDNSGISGAATAIGVAQPTVSQALRSLERSLGLQLFHRIGRGMVLTAAGRSFIGPSRQILRDVSAVEGLFASSSEDVVVGRLDISAWSGLANRHLTDLVARYRREHPGASVRLSLLKSEDQAATFVREGHCEFAVVHLPVSDGEGLETIELGEQEYWLAYPPGTDLPDGPISLSKIPDIPMVFAPTGAVMVDEVETTLRAAGIRPELSVLVAQRDVRLPMVEVGLGGTFVTRVQAAEAGDSAEFRACEPRLSRPYGLVFDPATLSAAGQAFVDLVNRSETGVSAEDS